MRVGFVGCLGVGIAACSSPPLGKDRTESGEAVDTAADGEGSGGTTDSSDSGDAVDSGDSGTTGPTEAVSVEMSDRIDCADPSVRDRDGAFHFLEDPDGLGSIEVFPGGLPGATMSAAIGDLNGDGELDIVHGKPDGPVVMLGRGDGTFVPASDGAWPVHPDGTGIASGIVLTDLDGDGDLDGIMTDRFHAPARYSNRGDGTFDVSWDLGEAFVDGGQIGPSLGDVDGDGHLELLVGGHQSSTFTAAEPTDPTPAGLYTLETGAITESGVALPESASAGYTFVTSLFDVDNDGDLDAYLANDHGAFSASNALLLGEGSAPDRTLVPDHTDSGLEVHMAAMSIAVGDLNEDGLPDIAVSNWGSPKLFLSDPDWGWFDAALTSGLDHAPDASVGWGTDFGDYDNDGDLDVYMAFGYLPDGEDDGRPNPNRQEDMFFENDGTGNFTNIAAELGVDDEYVGRTALMVDFNHDGFLDLYLGRQYRQPKVWLARCSTANWLSVALEGTMPNPLAYGAKVEIQTAAGTQTRWIRGGGVGFNGAPPPVAHFGLGSEEQVSELRITWPDGQRSVLTDLESRREYRVRRVAESEG